MRTRRISALLAAGATALVMTLLPGPLAHAGQAGTTSAVTAGGTGSAAAGDGSGTGAGTGVSKACAAAPAPRHDTCFALVRTDAEGRPLVSPDVSAKRLPLGYGPAQLQSAYTLVAAAAAAGHRQTVAIVDAYDDPNAEQDLGVYRAEYGLPPCTTANGCFTKVNQNGQAGPLPAANSDWGVEESLDLDMVSAICPNCHITLVESDDAADVDLAGAVATAARLGADEISNSYGEPEFAGENALAAFYDQPGVQITAAAGDSGYGVSFPAASADVTAVGGTSLTPAAGTRGWAETVWPGTGSGCSTQIPKPAWQHDACAHRTDNDVAAVADPGTPVATYDSFGGFGWLRAGGTSAASPIMAAAYALLGDPRTAGGAYFYQHPHNVFAVTQGTNGQCQPSYLCSGAPGYNGPTGLGSPDLAGTAAGTGGCVNNWSSTSTPARPTPRQTQAGYAGMVTVDAVDAIAPDDAWTVSQFKTAAGAGPAGSQGWVGEIEHWNGKRWSSVPSPTPISSDGFAGTILSGLSFDTPRDGWAVGNNAGTPLVEHWDGHRWTLSPVLDPIQTYTATDGTTDVTEAIPTAVAALSADNVWLVGDLNQPELLSAPGPSGSFVEHWDGSTWQLVTPPGIQNTALLAMHAVSADDIWAVGTTTENGGGSTSWHYDGHAWRQVSLPRDTTAWVNSVSASSAADVWAAGQHTDTDTGTHQPYLLHWNGHGWTTVPTPAVPVDGNNYAGLDGLVALSATNAWAVGSYPGVETRNNQFSYGVDLLEHWNGHTWTRVDTPLPPNEEGLSAISASGAGDIWIAGAQQLANPVPGAPDDFSLYPYLLHSGCGHA
jgi:hypothetical protein